ncbi:hypothetical protein C2E23DRAFT_581704 [Lenzites betulinus]|nr:hypothetical protein C2E23DRAFT_581704 [Lenzites betulinus]
MFLVLASIGVRPSRAHRRATAARFGGDTPGANLDRHARGPACKRLLLVHSCAYHQGEEWTVWIANIAQFNVDVQTLPNLDAVADRSAAFPGYGCCLQTNGLPTCWTTGPDNLCADRCLGHVKVLSIKKLTSS